MNSKGFTLLELLMSIVILALILVIAIPSVNNISQAIRENQRKNIIERIEIAASKYAFDTGETLIFVDKLVTEGYIESDDEEGNIDDPVNNLRMNCYVVEMEKTSEYYNAKFIDEKNYEVNGVCDLTKLQEDNTEISIEVYNLNGSITNTNNWLNGTLNGAITLKALSDSGVVNLDCSTHRCSWTSSGGASITGSDEITLNNINGILTTKYTFQITIYDDELDEVKRYKSSINLKIDNAAPTIYDNETSNSITNKFIETNSKEVTIIASDGKGSGLNSYYLAISNGQTCNSTGITYQLSNKFTVTKNGEYLICVKDNVGNTSSSKLTISHIIE